MSTGLIVSFSHSLILLFFFFMFSLLFGRSVKQLYASDSVGVLSRHTKSTCEDGPSCLLSVIAMLRCIFRAERMASAFIQHFIKRVFIYRFMSLLRHTTLSMSQPVGQYLGMVSLGMATVKKGIMQGIACVLMYLTFVICCFYTV